MHKILHYSTLLVHDESLVILLFIEFRLELFDIDFFKCVSFVRVLDIQKRHEEEYWFFSVPYFLLDNFRSVFQKQVFFSFGLRTSFL